MNAEPERILVVDGEVNMLALYEMVLSKAHPLSPWHISCASFELSPRLKAHHLV